MCAGWPESLGGQLPQRGPAGTASDRLPVPVAATRGAFGPLPSESPGARAIPAAVQEGPPALARREVRQTSGPGDPPAQTTPPGLRWGRREGGRRDGGHRRRGPGRAAVPDNPLASQNPPDPPHAPATRRAGGGWPRPLTATGSGGPTVVLRREPLGVRDLGRCPSASGSQTHRPPKKRTLVRVRQVKPRLSAGTRQVPNRQRVPCPALDDILVHGPDPGPRQLEGQVAEAPGRGAPPPGSRFPVGDVRGDPDPPGRPA